MMGFGHGPPQPRVQRLDLIQMLLQTRILLLARRDVHNSPDYLNWRARVVLNDLRGVLHPDPRAVAAANAVDGTIDSPCMKKPVKIVSMRGQIVGMQQRI